MKSKNNFTPFELSHTAIALCKLAKLDGKNLPPEHYFDAADLLLNTARCYLESETDRHAAMNRFAASFHDDVDSYRLAKMPIPFDMLLRTSNKPSSGKKPRTTVGSTTTRNGLEKAIRRYFSRNDASRIIKAAAMTGDELDKLNEAKANAIGGRAKKRVKSKSVEKIQPG